MVQKGAIQGSENGLKGIADLAFSADQKFVYIANKGSDSLSGIVEILKRVLCNLSFSI